MATASQAPGVLNLSFSRGENWAKLIDFSEPATIADYTFTAGLYSVVTGTLSQAITCTVVDAATGQLNLSLTAVQTAAMLPGTYHFRLTWGPTVRRIYEGYCEVMA